MEPQTQALVGHRSDIYHTPSKCQALLGAGCHTERSHRPSLREPVLQGWDCGMLESDVWLELKQ